MLLPSSLCYFRPLFAADYFYADDMAIMAPYIKALKALSRSAATFVLSGTFASTQKKTKILYFGPKVYMTAFVSTENVMGQQLWRLISYNERVTHPTPPYPPRRGPWT